MSGTDLTPVPAQGKELLPTRIAAVIHGRIEDGTYPAGSVLPPRPRLVEELGVSRSTVDHACRALRERGLLVSVPGRGRGTVVVDPLNPPTGPEVLARRGEGACETWPGRGSTRDTVDRITAAVRKRIADGTYRPGRRIPSVAELAEEFDCRTWLAREAVDVLKGEGLLYSLRPKGHFVCPDVAGARNAVKTTRRLGGGE
ncbi:GntR family transcriptional regulator [Streptomyces graminilatus]|uniref:GntR family transcriptional regulator n=1 Tax=Streptomyces graminilatus TaxID=1464070 RepID=UPI0006E29310|nr:winged helix-turn-helix domain-containing protein [Streptomyces graminilatus]